MGILDRRLSVEGERGKECVKMLGIFSFSNWMIVTALAGVFHVVNYCFIEVDTVVLFCNTKC